MLRRVHVAFSVRRLAGNALAQEVSEKQKLSHQRKAPIGRVWGCERGSSPRRARTYDPSGARGTPPETSCRCLSAPAKQVQRTRQHRKLVCAAVERRAKNCQSAQILWVVVGHHDSAAPQRREPSSVRGMFCIIVELAARPTLQTETDQLRRTSSTQHAPAAGWGACAATPRAPASRGGRARWM